MRRVFRTLNGKMLLLLLFVLLPMGTVVFLNGRSMERSFQTYQVMRLTDEAQLLAQTVSTRLGLLGDTLAYLPYSSDGFAKIHHSSREAMSSRDFWLAVSEVKQNFKSLQNIYPFVETLFVYDPGKELFLNGGVNEDMAGTVRDCARTGEASRPVWRTTASGYVYWVYPCGGYYVGVWMEAERLLASVCGGIPAGELGGETYLLNPLGETLAGARKITVSPALLGEAVPFEGTTLVSSYCAYPGLYVARTLSRQEGSLAGRWYRSNTVVIALLCALLFLSVAFGLSRWVLGPMRSLTGGIERITAGDIAFRFLPEREKGAEFQTIEQEFNAMMGRLENMRIQIYEQQLSQNETKLRYLSQQIQPHFILNSLNTLYSYSNRDVEAARRIIRLLSKYYRYVVNVESRYVELSQELEHIENYLSLQKIRFPHKLSYSIACEEAVKIVPIPPFLLESFVGNCLKHGQDEEDKICIRLEARQAEPFVIAIRIMDQGMGFPLETLDALERYQRTGEKDPLLGVGMINSMERLRLIYGEKASMRFENLSPQGACVQVTLTLGRGEGKEAEAAG